MATDPNDFSRRLDQARAFIRLRGKTIIRVEGVKHFKGSFEKEGFTDEQLEPWPDISEKRKAQKRKKSGRLTKILYDTGDLEGSITGDEESDGVTFSSDRPYAQRHNEGTDGMPKRQFMGPSKQLEQAIVRKFERELDKIFR